MQPEPANPCVLSRAELNSLNLYTSGGLREGDIDVNLLNLVVKSVPSDLCHRTT